jgi:sugar phosphate isomerase/epimerase
MPFALGYNTYSLRALRWNDEQLLDYAAGQQLDAIFLQDSPDPRSMDPAHWPEVRAHAQRLGLRLETGGGGVLPKTPEAFPSSVDHILKHADRAAAMGSPIVRVVCASERKALPPGPVEQHIETMIRLLTTVKSRVAAKGLKIAIEVHKDFQAWELKQIIEGAGPDFAGVYMDTGNPVFVMEHPMTTLETLGPYVLTFHLRDSVVYEHPNGIAVQWVPLGEGIIDFPSLLKTAESLCPNAFVYIKPITGRIPAILPIHDRDFWRLYPNAKAGDLARFLNLAKAGRPYDKYMVIEDAPGKPAELTPLIQRQQREHLESSLRYAKTRLHLGRR